jgi:hypothetical protein
MLAIVVTFNVGIALCCCFAAWKVWQLRCSLARIADTLQVVERNTEQLLRGAPQAMSNGQISIRQFRKRYRQLGIQWQQVQQMLRLLNGLQLVYGRASRLSISRRKRPGPIR